MTDGTIRKLEQSEVKPAIAAATRPVILDVGADWCAPCHMMHPFLAKLSAEFADRVEVLEVDADASPELKKEWEVKFFPTLLLFRDGALADRIQGFNGYAELRTAIGDFLGDGAGTPRHPEAEAAFVAAVERAKTEVEAAHPMPEHDPDSPMEKAYAALDAIAAEKKAEVEAGTITQEAFNAHMRAEADRMLAPFKEQLDELRAKSKARLNAYGAAVDAAAATFLQAHTAAGSEPPAGAFCSPDDPSCRIG